ncbi:hypothetical protein [Natronobeatus ordinarius]|uniref:hypothetical protein n=1 Tax=Natronobeatus ordinarius TaxID=2963433 RepID=UPI0020CC56AA|nr:hypothetical protein [Natronobeatus ordinarius]
MTELPYESLVGVSYGLLTGFVPAILVGLTAIGATVFRNRPLPAGAGVVTVPVAVALTVAMGVIDPGAGLSHGYRFSMVAIVTGLLGVVAVSYGNRIATEFPQDRTVPIVRGQVLSADAIDAVDAMGHVTIRPTGSIREFEGYPPLPPALRTALEDGAWRFPADLQLSELERRLECRLEAEYDLSLVGVSIDGRGRATIAAAPPAKGVATTLPAGTRAVTVSGLLPTGIEPGDTVAVETGETAVRATVLSVGTEVDGSDPAEERRSDADTLATTHRTADLGFDGGEGQLTVAVETSDAGRLLEGTRHRIAVLPNGDNHEFEVAALLEAAGQPVTVIDGPDADSITSMEVLGVHDDEGWQFAVGDEHATGGDRAFVAGPKQVVSE